MSQAISIRFQPPEHLSGPARDLLVSLRRPTGSEPIVQHDEKIEPVALPPSPRQEQLNARALRQKLRALEKERALKTVDGAATWIVTDRLSHNPDLGERIDNTIVGDGVGTGRIIYGPPDLCLPAGLYMAIIEFQVTNMGDRKRARVTGEVTLNNRTNLCQQTKKITALGKSTFHLPFRLREDDLMRHVVPAIEVRLNLKDVVGVTVTQVAVVFKVPGLHTLATQLSSGISVWFRRLRRSIAKPRT
ncbi:hypothetical protein [Brevundimonas sp. G8]|uniref:hypothetical protein n=1 Tax=Brevundimonas sp. G8 TaxID=1350776 RepID=UPI0012EF93EE|nr:hypothetical protein [Brevundimonas sp. G8]VXC01945.1 hypothetical protein BREVUG8_90029 [Brevundimonas sp. G8]